MLIMAMSHANCDHPSTPAARAACRKAFGAHVNFAIELTAATKPQTLGAPRSRSGGTTDTHPAVKTSQRRAERAYRIKDNGDMAAHAVPHAFSAVIRLAWERGWEVKAVTPYNDTEKRVQIRNGLGDATLVWRHTTPYGVHGQFWRPVNMSITHKADTVNLLVSYLEGKIQ